MGFERRQGPLLSAGFLLGAGLGGLADGILLHQILQWHHMLSSVVPTNDLVHFKVNMFWDGLFDASVWILTVLGLAGLWSAGKRRDIPWSGRTFLGALLSGWGFFNLVEGLIDHHWLGLHHVMEVGPDPTAWDLGYLAFGLVMLLVGLGFIQVGRRDTLPRGGPG